VTRWVAGVLCVLAGAVATATAAHGSCLPLPTSELRALDAQAEAQPEEAIRNAQARLAAATGHLAALSR
jgi:hypothetical protein